MIGMVNGGPMGRGVSRGDSAMLIALGAVLVFILVLFAILAVAKVLMDLVLLLLIATICGAIAESVLDYHPGGIGTTAGVGLIGAIVGWLLAKLVHLPTLVTIGHIPILWTVIGSVLLVG